MIKKKNVKFVQNTNADQEEPQQLSKVKMDFKKLFVKKWMRWRVEDKWRLNTNKDYIINGS